MLDIFVLFSYVYICIKYCEYHTSLICIKTKYRNILTYTNLIESQYDEVINFKHDYKNILTALSSYINDNDINELKKFLNDHVKYTEANLYLKNINISNLRYLKIPALKGLISCKLIYANSNNINISINIIENITEINMQLTDCCRILGILLDNAIESCTLCKNSSIDLTIVKKQNAILIVLENTYIKTNLTIDMLFKKGVSTKGKAKGRGLFIVKDIIDKRYPNTYLNTLSYDDSFIQELWIYNN
jgi:two-component system sensor histidine kinase AgrC